jgi:hypothetical protein
LRSNELVVDELSAIQRHREDDAEANRQEEEARAVNIEEAANYAAKVNEVDMIRQEMLDDFFPNQTPIQIQLPDA